MGRILNLLVSCFLAFAAGYFVSIANVAGSTTYIWAAVSAATCVINISIHSKKTPAND